MSFGVVFLVLAVGFLGLITLPKLLAVFGRSTEPDPQIRKSYFFTSSKMRYQNIIYLSKFSSHALSKAIATRLLSVAFGSTVFAVKVSIM